MNDKQRAFVREYLTDRNATQAAIRAGYSKKTANEQGSRLLANVKIREAVEAGEKKHAERCDVTIESLTEEYRQNLKMARESGQVSAANQAVTGIVELHGLKIIKTENLNKTYAVIDTPEQDADEWMEANRNLSGDHSEGRKPH